MHVCIVNLSAPVYSVPTPQTCFELTFNFGVLTFKTLWIYQSLQYRNETAATNQKE